MQITNAAATDTYRLHELHVHLVEGSGAPESLEIILVREIDGVQVSEPSYSMNAIAMGAWLDQTPGASLTRRQDLEQSLLQWVVDAGYVTGTVG